MECGIHVETEAGNLQSRDLVLGHLIDLFSRNPVKEQVRTLRLERYKNKDLADKVQPLKIFNPGHSMTGTTFQEEISLSSVQDRNEMDGVQRESGALWEVIRTIHVAIGVRRGKTGKCHNPVA